MIAFMAFIARFLPLLRVAGILITFMGYLLFIYHKGAEHEAAKQQQVILKEVKIHDKIETKVNGLSCPDVLRRVHKYERD